MAASPDRAPAAATLTPRERLRAWAELARISNLPTVVSNVIAGIGAFAGTAATGDEAGLPGTRVVGILLALVAVSLIYLGGMILNDVCDVEIDRTQRPGRPIPSGRVTRASALRAAVGTLVGGPVLLLFCNMTAALLGAALAGLVVLYNLIHTRWGISVFVMGLCRAMIYPAAVSAVLHSRESTYAAAYAGGLLGAYTAMFSMVARAEASGRLIRWPALVIPLWLLPLTVVAQLVDTVHPPHPERVLYAYLPYLLWTARAAYLVYSRPPRVVSAVVGWLAGICLFDAWLLAFAGRTSWIAAPLACFGIALWANRRIPGT